MSVFVSLPLFMTAIKTLIRRHFTVIIRYALLYFRPHYTYCMSTSHTAMMWQTEPARTKKWNTLCM